MISARGPKWKAVFRPRSGKEAESHGVLEARVCAEAEAWRSFLKKKSVVTWRIVIGHSLIQNLSSEKNCHCVRRGKCHQG